VHSKTLIPHQPGWPIAALTSYVSHLKRTVKCSSPLSEVLLVKGTMTGCRAGTCASR